MPKHTHQIIASHLSRCRDISCLVVDACRGRGTYLVFVSRKVGCLLWGTHPVHSPQETLASSVCVPWLPATATPPATTPWCGGRAKRSGWRHLSQNDPVWATGVQTCSRFTENCASGHRFASLLAVQDGDYFDCIAIGGAVDRNKVVCQVSSSKRHRNRPESNPQLPIAFSHACQTFGSCRMRRAGKQS